MKELFLAVLLVAISGGSPVSPPQEIWGKAVCAYESGRSQETLELLSKLKEKYGENLTPEQKERVFRLEKRAIKDLSIAAK